MPLLPLPPPLHHSPFISHKVPPHKHPYYMIPVFSFHAHRLSVYYQGGYYEYTQRHAEVPRLTQLQQEGIDMFAQVVCVCVWGGVWCV